MNSPAPEQRRVKIFDTTLRDGEQSPGAGLNRQQKVVIAKALADLGVDIIEAGFPICSPGDFDSVKAIADEIQNGPVIAGLARCREEDIVRAAEALRNNERRRIHVFLATSNIHREFKLRMTPEEVIQRAVRSITQAKNFTNDIEFSPEDAARTELEFLRDVVTAAIEAGATTINIPDTVGFATPERFAHVIEYLREHVPNIDRAIISVHCHNDLGLAVANSLAAVEHGAGQIECTVNGIGERAGNAALEEIVMAIKVRGDVYDCCTGVKTERLYKTSRLVSRMTGLPVQRNKAIVGRNAFAHEAGIHQDGMLKEPSTYEIMRPEDVGVPASDMVLGKHSGKNAVGNRLREMGFRPDEVTLGKIFDDFKRLCDTKKYVFDEDLLAIAEHHVGSNGTNGRRVWEIVEVTSMSSNLATPTAVIRLRDTATDIQHAAAVAGDGQIDAVFAALGQITGLEIQIENFTVEGVSAGRDAQGEVFIEASYKGRSYKGRGLSTDTVQAAAQAYIAILNAIAAEQKRNGDEDPPAVTVP